MSMRKYFLLVQIAIICLLTVGAKPHISKTTNTKKKELRVLELKLKQESSDKKISARRKYTLTILAAREMSQHNYKKESLEFYQTAKEIKTDQNKNEILLALSEHKVVYPSVFFYDVNLTTLLKNKSYEKAILSLNPDKLREPEFAKFRIIYDLLNIKLRKRMVKDLYCVQDYQKDPETYYQYTTLLCDLLIDYLKDGKLESGHFKVIEEYFLKHDLKESYLLQLAEDLK